MKITHANIVELLKSIGCKEENAYAAIFPKRASDDEKRKNTSTFLGMSYRAIYLKGSQSIEIAVFASKYKNVEIVGDSLVFDDDVAFNFG